MHAADCPLRSPPLIAGVRLITKVEIAFLVVGIIALIPIGYLLWEKYRSKSHQFEFSSKNILFARFVCPHNAKDENIGLLFYGLRILNSSKENLTVKRVLLHYTVDGIEHSTESHVIITGTISAPQRKKNIDAIIVKIGGNNIVLMDWSNLRTDIGEYKVLSPGEVLSGSALFVLNFDNLDKISKMENVKIIVIDYNGRKTTHPILIEKHWIKAAHDGAIIENRGFIEGENGEIIFT